MTAGREPCAHGKDRSLGWSWTAGISSVQAEVPDLGRLLRVRDALRGQLVGCDSEIRAEAPGYLLTDKINYALSRFVICLWNIKLYEQKPPIHWPSSQNSSRTQGHETLHQIWSNCDNIARHFCHSMSPFHNQVLSIGQPDRMVCATDPQKEFQPILANDYLHHLRMYDRIEKPSVASKNTTCTRTNFVSAK